MPRKKNGKRQNANKEIVKLVFKEDAQEYARAHSNHCKGQAADKKHQEKINKKWKNLKEERENLNKNRKNLNKKKVPSITDEECDTVICAETMFLLLPITVKATHDSWKPYWDEWLFNKTSKEIYFLSIRLCSSTLVDYYRLISLQRSFKMLAFSKIIITEYDILNGEILNEDIFKVIEEMIKDIDTSRYQKHFIRVQENENDRFEDIPDHLCY